MELGEKAYTQDGFEKNKDFMGVIALQTSLTDNKSQEIFELNKNRWGIETFYNYLKNQAVYNSLHLDNYYKTQGLAFILIVGALIFSEMKDATENIKGKSLQDCLLEAPMLKIHKCHNKQTVTNCLKKQKELFDQLGAPLTVENLLYT